MITRDRDRGCQSSLNNTSRPELFNTTTLKLSEFKGAQEFAEKQCIQQVTRGFGLADKKKVLALDG